MYFFYLVSLAIANRVTGLDKQHAKVIYATGKKRGKTSSRKKRGWYSDGARSAVWNEPHASQPGQVGDQKEEEEHVFAVWNIFYLSYVKKTSSQMFEKYVFTAGQLVGFFASYGRRFCVSYLCSFDSVVFAYYSGIFFLCLNACSFRSAYRRTIEILSKIVKCSVESLRVWILMYVSLYFEIVAFFHRVFWRNTSLGRWSDWRWWARIFICAPVCSKGSFSLLTARTFN